jgi:RND family efflux transporter MFP subunit
VQRQQAEEQVAATRLVSPADGVVTLRAVDPGQIAQPGQPLVTLASGSLFLEAPVSSPAVGALRIGQPVQVQTDTRPGRSFPAVMSDVPTVPGPDGRTYTVRARLISTGSSTRPAISPGVRARGIVQVARADNALLVPPAALVQTATGTAVWIARNGKAERRPISAGIVTDAAVQVLSGLSSGDAVIISGAEGLHPGDAIDVGSAKQGRGLNDTDRAARSWA